MNNSGLINKEKLPWNSSDLQINSKDESEIDYTQQHLQKERMERDIKNSEY